MINVSVDLPYHPWISKNFQVLHWLFLLSLYRLYACVIITVYN